MKRFRERFLRNSSSYLMLAPALILYIIFVIYPLIKGFYVSFHRWDGLSEMEWIGLKNYKFVFKDKIFWLSMKNTLLFAVVVTIFKNIVGFSLAILMNMEIKGRTLFRTAAFMPVTFAFVVTGILWSWIYNPVFGLLNNLLTALHLDSLIQGWLSDPKIALWSIMFVDIWKWSGFHMVLYLAGLQSIPIELYEAAMIDGASRFRSLIHITIPLLSHVTIVNILLSITGSFVNNYDLVYVMTGGGPFHSTEVALTWIISNTFRFAAVGKANAMSIILIIVVAVFGILQLKLTTQQDYEM